MFDYCIKEIENDEIVIFIGQWYGYSSIKKWEIEIALNTYKNWLFDYFTLADISIITDTITTFPFSSALTMFFDKKNIIGIYWIENS